MKKQRKELMSHVREKVLAAFDAMDDERQIEMAGFLEDVAREFPRQSRLRLVSNVAGGVQLLAVGKEAG